MSLVETIFGGLRRTPAASIVNTVTALAGIVGLTIAVATAAQPAFEVKDYAGRSVLVANGSGALSMSGALKVHGGLRLVGTDCSGFTNGGTLTTDALGNLICDNDTSGGGSGGGNLSGTGANTQLAFFTDVQTLSGARLFYSSALATLENPGTFSGRILRAADLLTTSGALAIEGGMWQDGFGTCNSSTQKPIYSAVTGKWTCGTDVDTVLSQEQVQDFAGAMDGGTETLISVTYNDGTNAIDYVVDSSVIVTTEIDTLAELETIMAGINIIQSTEIDTFAELDTLVADKALTNTADAFTWASLQTFTSGFEAIGTGSGRILHAQNELRSSGSLIVDGGFWQDGLLDADGATQKVLYDLATGKFTAGTDDDVPESGDFAAGVDLEADGSLSADVVSTAEMADADHGDVSWTGGVASVENVTCTDCINATEIEDIYVLNTGDVVAGDLEIVGIGSGRTLHAQDQLRSSGSLIVEGASALQGNTTIRGTLSGATTVTLTAFKSCTALETNSQGALACGSDDVGAGSFDQGETDKRYVQKQGSTLTGSLLWSGQGNGIIPLNIASPLGQTADFFRISSGTYLPFQINRVGAVTVNTGLTETGGLILASSHGANSTFYDAPTLSFLGRYTTGAGVQNTHEFQFINDVTNAIGSAQFLLRYRLNDGSWVNSMTMSPSGAVTFPAALNLTGKTNGGVLFYDSGFGVIEDDANFFWDDTLNFLGLGTAAPETRLEVIGTASGRILHAQDQLRSSGSLVIEGAGAIQGVLTAADFVCISAGCIGAAELGTDSVSADELNATGVEAELEAVLDLQELQGALIAGQYGAATVDGDDVNSNIAGRSLSLTAASPDTLDADAELYTDTKCAWIENPTAADDFKSIWRPKLAATITSIWAESDQTVTFMLQVDDGSPADVDSVDLAPAAGTAEDTSLNGDATLAAGDRLDLDVASVASTPTWVSICWTYTYDD